MTPKHLYDPKCLCGRCQSVTRMKSGAKGAVTRTKTVRIEANFPDLPGGIANQTGSGQGSSVRVAIAKAFANLLKQPKLKRKHYSEIRAVITIGTIIDAPEIEAKDNEGGKE
jgi:hypothetical protein